MSHFFCFSVGQSIGILVLVNVDINASRYLTCWPSHFKNLVLMGVGPCASHNILSRREHVTILGI